MDHVVTKKINTTKDQLNDTWTVAPRPVNIGGEGERVQKIEKISVDRLKMGG